MHATIAQLVAILALASLQPGGAELVRRLDVGSLVAAADLIVVGEVTEVIGGERDVIMLNERRVEVTESTAVIRVDEVLKGRIEDRELRFRFHIPQTPTAQIQPVPVHQYALLFLRDDHGSITVADPTYPFLRALPGKVRRSEPIDGVALALGQVLMSDRLSKAERGKALDALVTIRTPVSRDILVTAMNTTKGDFQLLIAAGLVGSGEVAGLHVVERALLEQGGLPGRMADLLGGSLAGLRDPQAIPSLARLMALNSPRVRLGVATALRQSRSPGAIGPLVRFLDDRDWTVRYYAVVGLGEITGQDEWTPSIDAFQGNPERYLAHWRDWAAANGYVR